MFDDNYWIVSKPVVPEAPNIKLQITNKICVKCANSADADSNILRFYIVLISSIVLLFFTNVNASLKNDSAETTITGFTHEWHGGGYSDGKRLVLGNSINDNPGNGTVYIFNSIPSQANTPLTNANATISGFNGKWLNQMPFPCIVGSKLIVSDSDPGGGAIIRIWESMPDTNGNSLSSNSKITGFDGVYHIATDGTKLCALGKVSGLYSIRIWNSVPASDVTVASADAYCTDNIFLFPSFGASGKFYLSRYGDAVDTYFVYIYNSVPSGSFNISGHDAKVTIRLPSGNYISSFELRNMLYVFVLKTGDSKIHSYIWNTIPTALTADTTTVSNEYVISQNFTRAKAICDNRNIYIWDSPNYSNTYIYKNDYDTLTITGASLAPSSIDQRHLDQCMEKITIYAYPGKATLNSLQVSLTGSCANTDVSLVKLYHDVDNNGAYGSSSDVLLGSGTFSNNKVTFSNVNLQVDAGEKALLIAYDISANAGLGSTIGASVDYLVFDKRYYEYPSPAITSSLSTIVASIIPVWNGELRVNYTQNQSGSDTLFSISLDWDDATGGAPPLIYKIYHLVDDSIVEEISETQSSRIFTNLDCSRTHKFKAKVVDAFGNETQESNLAYDDSAPQWQGIFKVIDVSKVNAVNVWEYKIKISWDPAIDNTSANVFYEVSLKEENKGWEIKGITWDNSYEMTSPTGTVYLRMRARDSAGNYSGYSAEKKIKFNPFLMSYEEKNIGIKGDSVALEEAEGEKIQIEIPEGALSRNYTVGIEKLMDAEYTYKFSVLDSSGNERKVIFSKPVAIKFYYNDNRLLRIGFKEDDLQILYFDERKWVKIGSELNRTENTVKTEVYRFSKYKLASERDSSKRVFLSSEIITPNDDEINDVLIFNMGWNYTGDAQARICDMDGKTIWQYSGNQKAIVWNGKRENGVPAETGAYIYSIRVEGQVFNGTVFVAR